MFHIMANRKSTYYKQADPELQNHVKITSHSSAFVSKMAPKSIYQIEHTIIFVCKYKICTTIH
jgi:hypothetical protein